MDAKDEQGSFLASIRSLATVTSLGTRLCVFTCKGIIALNNKTIMTRELGNKHIIVYAWHINILQ
jgi:hypothetical protein